MKEIIRCGLILFAITAVAGLLLGSVNIITEEPITAQDIKMQEDAMRIVFPNFEYSEELYTESNESVEEKRSFLSIMFSGQKSSDDSVKKVQKCLTNGNVVGYVFNVTTSGYGGKINMMVGLDTNGTLTGISILSNSETPGLGAEAKNDFFTSRFIGKSKFPLSVSKSESAKDTDNEVQAITSATITSNAVVLGVNEAYSWFSQNIKEAN